jgi:dihydrodipicolinate synthase/N-acetylneuraminate lyase
MFKLQGVVPPMITPFDRNGELDVKNLEKLLEFLKDRVNGLYICGSYGSGPLMSLEERKRVAEVCVNVVDGKIPVIAHTGTTNTRDTVELTRHAQRIGCDGAAAVGPYYYHHKEDALMEFYSSMIDCVDSGYPIYLYHNIKFSGYEIPLAVIKKLKDKGLHGIKDATFDILTHATYQRELNDGTFDVVLGTEAMWLSARSLGTEAYIPGLGNAFPEICARMWRQGMDNDFEACRRTQFEVNKLRQIMYLARSTQLAVYAMLEIRGVIAACPRSPFVPATEEEKAKIARALEQMEIV